MIDRLPHGPGFRFLTRVRALEPGVVATGAWDVSGAEPFFTGHFPGDPVVPGVLIGEALAQLSGLVAASGRHASLAHIDVRFDHPVRPPAEIVLRSALERTFGTLARFEVEASVGEVRAARGTVTLAFSDEERR